MNFLEARRIVAEFAGGPDLPFLFGLSGTGDPFRIYLEAAAARRGRRARPHFLPFNTLNQHLVSESTGVPEVFLLLPWDFSSDLDWRSGVPTRRTDLTATLATAAHIADQLRHRRGARLMYLPAPVPPVTGHRSGDESLVRGLDSLAAGSGASMVAREAFSLSTYFGSGCPVGGAWLGHIAELAVAALTSNEPAPGKVLVTDLDNTLWAGVIAEDGPEAIGYRPEGSGYRHHVYQSLLARLQGDGVLLAAVSRNDLAAVLPPLRAGQMLLVEEQFVAVLASYHAKSAQIGQLATHLNLGLESFVFVDDNPVELEEVRRALPQVRCLAFPTQEGQLPGFLATLAACFEQREVTAEDRARTSLYRRRTEGIAPAAATGADLTGFLAGLEMRLTVHDRSRGDRARAVQLINKTNQFNANGHRWTDEEILRTIDAGGKLFCASLSDRSGGHGEVVACLINADGIIEAFVMSCRVFQRRVEYAFLAALSSSSFRPVAVRHAPTERNAPFSTFLNDAAFSDGEPGIRQLDAITFAASHSADAALFEVAWD